MGFGKSLFDFIGYMSFLIQSARVGLPMLWSSRMLFQTMCRMITHRTN